MLSDQPARTYTKQQQCQKNRSKKTAKQRGDISDKVRKAVAERCGGRCEWCGWWNGGYDKSGRRWGLECAHLIRRPHIKGETTVNDVAFLCGPSVNSGTCHWKVDYTKAVREWAAEYRKRLYGEKEPNG